VLYKVFIFYTIYLLCSHSFDDMLSVGRPVDDMSLSYADVITELFD